MSKLSFALLLAVLSLACGGPDPEQQCEDLLKTICKRARVCGEEVLGEKAPANFESDCVENVQDTALDKDCSHAVDVTSSYDTCIDEIESSSCDDFLDVSGSGVKIDPPASCSKVIRLE
ncbi:MAG TPA: hypothetical protein VJR89_28650 [Polyangiales bacterium]|nr:hypothetical protein [Polyangiales bacterium]